MWPLWALLAQAASPPGGGTSSLTNILIAILAGGIGVAVINWLRERNKDVATTGQIDAQRRSIVEDVNEVIWKRTQAELERADRELEEERQARRAQEEKAARELEDEREARRAVERKAAEMEKKLDQLRERIRQVEQRAAEEQSAAYAALLEAIPDAVVQAGQYGLIKSVNAAALKLFGYESRDDMLGQPVTSLMPQRYRQAHVAGFNEALLTEKGRLLDTEDPVRVRALHADGHEFDAALRLSMQGHCFTAVIRPYLKRDGGELDLLDFPD